MEPTKEELMAVYEVVRVLANRVLEVVTPKDPNDSATVAISMSALAVAYVHACRGVGMGLDEALMGIQNSWGAAEEAEPKEK